jgi:hypothetical protein
MANEITNHLTLAGFTPLRVSVDGEPIELSWQQEPAEPIVDNRVILVLPDLHLGDGGDSDIFRGAEGLGPTHRQRFESFLSAVVLAKAELATRQQRLSVVQLGDCYDVWRAFPFHEHVPGRTYSAIRTAYTRIESLLIDDLDTRFCVGNHDAILAQYPPDWAFTSGARLAYSQRFCAGRVFAFHGHQGDVLSDQLAGQHGQFWVALGSTLSAIMNPAGIALQQLIDQQEDTYPGDEDGGWPVGAAPTRPTRFECRRWSDYQGRPERFRKMLETVPPLSQAIRLVVVGHTHRPGLSWFELGGRVIPVLDVGSWTYGRSQFAIIEAGSASVWQL